ncbi:MAG: hypothetical protein ACI85E_002284, partial [Marinomonas primoryensis]
PNAWLCGWLQLATLTLRSNAEKVPTVTNP